MDYDSARHHRRSTRLRGWDYTHAGWYYVTIVVKDRQCAFGWVVNGVIEDSPLGLVADACWRGIPRHRADVRLAEHIVMPNHLHGIVIIDKEQRGEENVRGGVVCRRDVDGRGVSGRDVQLNVPTGNTNSTNIQTTDTDAPNAPTSYLSLMNNHAGDSYPAGVPMGISPAKGSLCVVIRTFKAAVTTWARPEGSGDFGWLGRFHDHII